MLINLKKLTAMTALMIAVSLMLPQSCHAGANEYSLQQDINVAILRVPTANSSTTQSGATPGSGSLKAPYIFDILNNRPDIKPPMWHLQNPMATVTVDAETNSRWGNSYTDNAQVTPNMAAYWEVDFNKVVSASSLTQFNLLVIRSDGLFSMTENQRSILRQFVDEGGTLWIDSNESTVTNPTVTSSLDNSNIFRVMFGNTASASAAVTTYHPVASSPFSFSGTAIDALGYGGVHAGAGSGCLTLLSSVTSGASTFPPDPTSFVKLSSSLYAGDYGSGHVVIDGLGIGDWINLDGGTQAAYQSAWSAGTTYTAGQVVFYNGVLYYCIAKNSGVTPTSDSYSKNLFPYHHTYWTANGDAFDATSYSSASAQDLKFLVNVISYATVSSTPGGNPRGNSVQGGNISGSVAPSWTFLTGTLAQPYIPTGTATYGKFVYTTDMSGNLNCFDVNPAESIFPSAVNGDDGLPDLSLGASYDRIWTVVPKSGSPLSAPVIAQLPIGGVSQPEVIVEDEYGNVYGYAATSSTASSNFTLTGSGAGSFSGTPPAPSYYRGEVLAPEPVASGGEVAVWNMLAASTGNIAYPAANSQSSFSFPVDSTVTGGTALSWVQPLSVASIPSNDGTFDADSLVAYAVTTSGIQSYQLGSRDEQLNANASNATTTTTEYQTYSTNLRFASGTEIFGAPEDTYNNVAPYDYVLDYTQPSIFSDGVVPPATTSAVTVNAIGVPIIADYDIIPNDGTTPARELILPQITNGDGLANSVAGAAVGPDNIVYSTVNELAGTTGSAYIEAVNEQNSSNTGQNTPTISWRFELDGYRATLTTPAQPIIDGDGINYAFYGDTFVGAPVVGNNGLVYAIANGNATINGASTPVVDVFAFNTKPEIGFSTSSVQGNSFVFSQNDEFGNPVQVTQVGGSGTLQIGNFSGTNNGTLTPDVYAPGSIIVTPTSAGTPEAALAVPVSIDTALDGTTPMLEWYTEIVGSTATSAPRQIGDYLYFGLSSTGSPSTLAAVYDNPAAIGLEPDASTRFIANPTTGSPQTVGGVAVNYTPDYRFLQQIPVGNITVSPNTSGLPLVTLPPAATGKSLVVASAGTGSQLGGFEGLSYDTDLVADGNRLIEFDPAGNATWTLDSTQQATQNGTAVNTTTNALETTSAETSVPLNRPSTVTQLSADDYLIADSGNNRCVHVDRNGVVLTQLTDSLGNTLIPTYAGVNYGLEISTFSDPLGLLPVGQPTSLSKPNSVVTWLSYDYGTSGSVLQAINVHYLIADNGNKRVLDIVDRYISVAGGGGNLFELGSTADYHYLNWISRTSDVGGRAYAYVQASPMLLTGSSQPSVYYPESPTTANTDVLYNQASAIIGVIGDLNIPQLDTTQPSHMTTVDQDSPGSSVVLLGYTSGQAYSVSNATGLPVALINSVSYNPGGAATTTSNNLRGLRSAIAVTDIPTPPAFGSFVIADDDGVFSGAATISSTLPASAATYYLDATYTSGHGGWSFISGDYANIVSTYDNLISIIDPLPGSPTPVRTDFAGTPFVPASAIALSGNNFLIVNRGASQNQNSPNQGGNDNGFGGNVFTIHADLSSTAAPVDSLDGPIYGKPANTGALSAPTFAIQSY